MTPGEKKTAATTDSGGRGSGRGWVAVVNGSSKDPPPPPRPLLAMGGGAQPEWLNTPATTSVGGVPLNSDCMVQRDQHSTPPK